MAVRPDQDVSRVWCFLRLIRLFQNASCGVGQFGPQIGAFQNRACLRPCANGPDRGAGGNGAQIVADHVGQDIGGDRGRGRMAQEPAAFQFRQLLADKVHFHNVQTAAQQQFVDRGFVRQTHWRLRRRNKRRSPTGNQRNHLIVCGGRRQKGHHVFRRVCACLIRYRVPCTQNRRTIDVHIVFVVGDGQRLMGGVDMGQSLGHHARGGFADGDDQGAAHGLWKWGG